MIRAVLPTKTLEKEETVCNSFDGNIKFYICGIMQSFQVPYNELFTRIIEYLEKRHYSCDFGQCDLGYGDINFM